MLIDHAVVRLSDSSRRSCCHSSGPAHHRTSCRSIPGVCSQGRRQGLSSAVLFIEGLRKKSAPKALASKPNCLAWAGRGWSPVDLPYGPPRTFLTVLSANEPKGGVCSYASNSWFDPGIDQPLAGGLIFLEYFVWIHHSYKHAAAELLGPETCPRLGEGDQVARRRFQACWRLKATAAPPLRFPQCTKAAL